MLDASRAVPVVSSLLSDDSASRLRRRRTATTTRRAARRSTPAPKQKLVPLEDARANRTPIELARRGHSAAGVHRRARARQTSRSRRCASSSTGRRSSTPGNCAASIRRSFEHEKYGEQARKLFADAQALLDRHHREEAAHRARRLWLLPRERRRRRRRALHRRVAQRRAHALPLPAPADGEGERRAEPLARRLHRAEGDRPARPPRGHSP